MWQAAQVMSSTYSPMRGSKWRVNPMGSWSGLAGARRRIDEEAVLAHVVGCGEALARQRQLEIHEPVVTHRAGGGALRHRSALRGVVVALAQRARPGPSPQPWSSQTYSSTGSSAGMVCTGHHTNQANKPTAASADAATRPPRIHFISRRIALLPARTVAYSKQTTQTTGWRLCTRLTERCKCFMASKASRGTLVSLAACRFSGHAPTVTTLIPGAIRAHREAEPARSSCSRTATARSTSPR